MMAMHTKRTTGPGSRTTDEPVPNILLRSARKQMGWTQQEVADRLGVGVASVGRWERGELVPRGYARLQLCRLFGSGAEELGFASGQGIPVAGDAEGPGPVHDRWSHEGTYTAGRRPFHEQLRYERQRRGWSQADLAERVGSDTKAISRWERGLSFPSPFFQQRLVKLFVKDAEELGLLETGGPQEARGSYRTLHTLHPGLSVHCGDCGQPGITGMLETMVIDPGRACTTLYFRFTNRTKEDAGLKFESVSLTNPNGDFFLGRSVGSFLLGAEQSIPLSVVFDWIPQRKVRYTLNVVLIRPGKWRNSYRPISLTA